MAEADNIHLGFTQTSLLGTPVSAFPFSVYLFDFTSQTRAGRPLTLKSGASQYLLSRPPAQVEKVLFFFFFPLQRGTEG